MVEEKHAPADFGAWARRLCDRNRGLGADGVLLYVVEPEDRRVRMRLVNADGGEAEISGNGLRCLAAYVVWKGWLPPDHTVLTTPGPRPVVVAPAGPARFRIRTDLGAPILESDRVPTTFHPPAPRVVDHPLEVAGETVRITATSLGNPHCAVFVDAPPDDERLRRLGPLLETHPFFPQRTNVEFVHVRSAEELRVRMWERGVGYTQASGTGSASACVAAVIGGRAGRKVQVVCDGGTLEVEWPEGGHVHQVGEVEVLFEGDWVGPA
jgi:diaminopimelate epimerase